MMFRLLTGCLFTFLIFAFPVCGGEERASVVGRPLLVVADGLSWRECQPFLGNEAGKGILFSCVESPPHAAMKRTALLTGRHAFFSSVYGDFPSQNRFLCPSLPFDLMEGSLRFSLPVWFSPETPLLLVGHDFAWWRGAGAGLREEARPVTFEDMGAVLRLASGGGNSVKAGAAVFDGRDVRQPGVWEDLPTHVGKWAANVSAEKARYRGGRVFCQDGVWEDTLFWKGVSADQMTPEQLTIFAEKSRLYADWWKEAISCLKEPVPLSFSVEEELKLGPNDWGSSVVEIGMPFMPAGGTAWKKDDILSLMDSPPPGGVGGSWRIDVPREGNYEIVFSLSSGETGVCFKKGEVFVRIGDGMATMELMEGATQVRLRVDLKAGAQYLEINAIAQGQGRDVSLSVPYARLRYLGERLAPVLTPRKQG